MAPMSTRHIRTAAACPAVRNFRGTASKRGLLTEHAGVNILNTRLAALQPPCPCKWHTRSSCGVELISEAHLPTFRHIAAPAQERWGRPEQGPDPREGAAGDGVTVLEPKVSQGSADHDVPLQGQDGQGPQPHDAWGEEEVGVWGTAWAWALQTVSKSCWSKCNEGQVFFLKQEELGGYLALENEAGNGVSGMHCGSDHGFCPGVCSVKGFVQHFMFLVHMGTSVCWHSTRKAHPKQGQWCVQWYFSLWRPRWSVWWPGVSQLPTQALMLKNSCRTRVLCHKTALHLEEAASWWNIPQSLFAKRNGTNQRPRQVSRVMSLPVRDTMKPSSSHSRLPNTKKPLMLLEKLTELPQSVTSRSATARFTRM